MDNLLWVTIVGFVVIVVVVTNAANKLLDEIRAVQKQLSDIERI